MVNMHLICLDFDLQPFIALRQEVFRQLRHMTELSEHINYRVIIAHSAINCLPSNRLCQ